MTQLTFTQGADNMWIATATVNGDFAIHLERETPGYEADSYSCVISQGGKAVEWSSFTTESE